MLTNYFNSKFHPFCIGHPACLPEIQHLVAPPPEESNVSKMKKVGKFVFQAGPLVISVLGVVQGFSNFCNGDTTEFVKDLTKMASFLKSGYAFGQAAIGYLPTIRNLPSDLIQIDYDAPFDLKKPSTPATMEYYHCVVNAKKIRDFLKKTELEQHFVVPQKVVTIVPDFDKHLLMLSEKVMGHMRQTPVRIQGQPPNTLRIYYPVLVEKVKFSDELVKMEEPSLRTNKAVKERNLTNAQVNGLAQLAIAGLSVPCHAQMRFTEDGKLILFNTEALHRPFKKQVKSTPVIKYWFKYDRSELLVESLKATTELKFICTESQKRHIEKMEKQEYVSVVTRNLAKMAFLVFAGYYALPKVLPSSMTSLIKMAALVPIVMHGLQVMHLRKAYRLSLQGRAGLEALKKM